MKNWVYLYSQSIPANLASYLGDRPDRLAGSEIPLGPSARNHFDVRVPDLIVALDCDVERVIAERGYSLESQGKPPDFILDIAPGFAFRSDYAARRLDFARYGVREYWRFDGGDCGSAPALEGERLVNGNYEPINVDWLDAERARAWGYSQVLRLYVCLEYANLRFYSPERESHLLTYQEVVDLTKAADARADAEIAHDQESYLLTYQDLADRVKAAESRAAAADRRHAEQVSRRLAQRARNLRREE